MRARATLVTSGVFLSLVSTLTIHRAEVKLVLTVRFNCHFRRRRIPLPRDALGPMVVTHPSTTRLQIDSSVLVVVKFRSSLCAPHAHALGMFTNARTRP